MKKQLFSILLIFTVSIAQAKPYFSNAIIFGDSLSDIGNFPQSPKPFVSKKHLSQWHGYDELYYVPISNPVNRAGFKVNLKQLFSLKHSYPWPDISNNHLEVAKSRKNHSLSWTEFFVNDAYNDGITPNYRMIPSATLESNPILYADLSTSVDYAWVSATSLGGCTFHKNYKKLSKLQCSMNSILKARSKYIKDRSQKNYRNMIVPGMLRQVGLLIEDVKHKKVRVGPNTIYIIYIGGNDFIYDYSRVTSLSPDKILDAFKNIAYSSSEHVYKAALKLIKTPAVSAKHIYIVTLFNPSFTPAFSEFNVLSRAISSLVNAYYNFELYRTVVDINKQFPGHVVLVNGNGWYAAMHSERHYHDIFNPHKRSKACELSSKAYQQYETPKANCKGYLFWNSIHPTMAAQQIFGYRMERAIIHSLK